MTRCPWLVLLVLATTLSGCKDRELGVGGKPRPKLYGNVISLSPGASEIIGQFGGQGALKGRTQSCDYPPHAVATVPVVASVKPDYEKIARLRPDLIVFDPVLYSDTDVEKIRNLGADLVRIQGDTVDEYLDALTRLATIVGLELTVAKYVDEVKTTRNVAQSEAPSPRPRMAILMPGGGREHMIAGAQSFQADLARAAGAEAVGPSGDRFVPLAAEAFLRLDPDIIVVAGNADSVVQDPRFGAMRAIKNGKVYGETPGKKELQDMLLRRGVRVPQIITKLSAVVRAGAAGQ